MSFSGSFRWRAVETFVFDLPDFASAVSHRLSRGLTHLHIWRRMRMISSHPGRFLSRFQIAYRAMHEVPLSNCRESFAIYNLFTLQHNPLSPGFTLTLLFVMFCEEMPCCNQLGVRAVSSPQWFTAEIVRYWNQLQMRKYQRSQNCPDFRELHDSLRIALIRRYFLFSLLVATYME